MDLIQKALEFEQRKVVKYHNQRVLASREVKSLILSLNEVFKKTKEPELMDLMKKIDRYKTDNRKKIKRTINNLRNKS